MAKVEHGKAHRFPAIRGISSMHTIDARHQPLVGLCALLLAAAGGAHASLVFNAVEDGADVLITGSGTADLTGLSSLGSMVFPGGRLQPDKGVVVGPLDASIDLYVGTVTGPSGFGPGTEPFVNSDSGSGNLFGLDFLQGIILFPQGYSSGGLLSGSARWNDQTFATLGMTPGTYAWSWGSDSVTLSVVAASAPLPSTLALIAGGALALRRRVRVPETPRTTGNAP